MRLDPIPIAPLVRPILVVVLLALSGIVTKAARLRSEAASAWTAYLSATQSRIAHELRAPAGFLALDFDADGAAERRAVRGGAVVVRSIHTLDARGERIEAPSARIHHWRGDVLIPGVSVAELVGQLRRGIVPRQEDVLAFRVLDSGPDRLRVYLRLQRTSLITVVYNTEHVVTFAADGGSRATSTSEATKIAEVSRPNTPEEREIPAGDDHGFLWRLQAYWRYEGVSEGVIAECESIALSRDVPSLARYLVDPLVERTARESMTRTMLALRAQFGKP